MSLAVTACQAPRNFPGVLRARKEGNVPPSRGCFLGHHRRDCGECDNPGNHETQKVFHDSLLPLPCLPPMEVRTYRLNLRPVLTPDEGQVLPERHILSRACLRWRSGLTGLSCIPCLPPERVQVLPERKKAQVIHWHFCINGDLRPVRRTYENN